MSTAPSERPDYPPFTNGSLGNSASVRRGGGARAAGWFGLAVLLALAIAWGFLIQPPATDPFADPRPLISLDWWLRPLPHRALATVSEVPVGTRGAFLPRAAADRAKQAERQLNGILRDAAGDTPDHLLLIIDPKQPGEPVKSVEITGGIQIDRNFSEVFAADCTRVVAVPQGGFNAVGSDCPQAHIFPREVALAFATSAQRVYSLLRTAPGNLAAQGPPVQQAYDTAPSAGKSGLPPIQQGPAQRQINAPPSASSSAPSAIQQGAVQGGAEIAPGTRIAMAPMANQITGASWKTLAQQAEFDALFDIAVAPDDSFGIAVGNDGIAFRFEPEALKATRISLPVTTALTSAHIAADGAAWAVSELEDGRRTIIASFDHGVSWQLLDRHQSPPAPWVTFLAMPLFLFALGGGIRASILQRQQRKAGAPYVDNTPNNDNPIGLKDHDSLNFRPIARAVELFIRNINTVPPLIIAVTGEWGSGKSSLMNLVKELLERGGARPVWFNAWHHQHEEGLLAALLENIREQAIPRFWTWPGLSFRLRLLKRRLVRELRWVVALVLLIAALVFLLALSGYHSLSDVTGVSHWVGYLGNIDLLAAPVVIAIPVLALRLLRLLKVFPDSAEAIWTQIRRPKAGDIRDKLNFRYRFAREFEETADVMRTPLNPGMVIFIDDLDRCRPDSVVEILEAVNFVSGAGKCVIVLGMSKRMVSRAIWRAHEDLFKDEWGVVSENTAPEQRAELQRRHRTFSENFLEKLINIELALPVLKREQSEALLTKPPAPVPGEHWAARIRSLVDWVYELGPSLVAACLLFLAFYFTPLPASEKPPAVAPAATFAAPAASPTPAPVASGPGSAALLEAVAPPAPPPAPAPPAAAVSSPQTLVAKYADHGWVPPLAIALACTVLLLAFAVRYLMLATRPKVSDTADFEEALKLWAPVVSAARATPRFVKRFQNRVRYFAMRMRPLPEEAHLADRIAQALFRDLRQRALAAQPDAASTDGMAEANIVALTALRAANPSLVAPGEGSIGERLNGLLPANDDPNQKRWRTVAEALAKHERRFGSLEADRRKFSEIDPQDTEETGAQADDEDTVEAPVRAA